MTTTEQHLTVRAFRKGLAAVLDALAGGAKVVVRRGEGELVVSGKMRKNEDSNA